MNACPAFCLAPALPLRARCGSVDGHAAVRHSRHVSASMSIRLWRAPSPKPPPPTAVAPPAAVAIVALAGVGLAAFFYLTTLLPQRQPVREPTPMASATPTHPAGRTRQRKGNAPGLWLGIQHALWKPKARLGSRVNRVVTRGKVGMNKARRGLLAEIPDGGPAGVASALFLSAKNYKKELMLATRAAGDAAEAMAAALVQQDLVESSSKQTLAFSIAQMSHLAVNREAALRMAETAQEMTARHIDEEGSLCLDTLFGEFLEKHTFVSSH